jgi:ABC-type antimicrobial peptide transport system permease subunit
MLLLAAGSLLLHHSLLGQIVYQANPSDPAVLGGAILTMTLLGLAASALPARRALAVDPSKLMRED